MLVTLMRFTTSVFAKSAGAVRRPDTSNENPVVHSDGLPNTFFIAILDLALPFVFASLMTKRVEDSFQRSHFMGHQGQSRFCLSRTRPSSAEGGHEQDILQATGMGNPQE
jgi:hypothetical protein